MTWLGVNSSSTQSSHSNKPGHRLLKCKAFIHNMPKGRRKESWFNFMGSEEFCNSKFRALNYPSMSSVTTVGACILQLNGKSIFKNYFQQVCFSSLCNWGDNLLKSLDVSFPFNKKAYLCLFLKELRTGEGGKKPNKRDLSPIRRRRWLSKLSIFPILYRLFFFLLTQS